WGASLHGMSLSDMGVIPSTITMRISSVGVRHAPPLVPPGCRRRDSARIVSCRTCRTCKNLTRPSRPFGFDQLVVVLLLQFADGLGQFGVLLNCGGDAAFPFVAGLPQGAEVD